VTSANSLHLATITEVTDEDKLVPVINMDELSDKEYEPGHIDWLVEVLQARAKDIRDSKKKAGPPHQTPAKSIQSDENQPLQPSLLVPKVVVPPKPPSAKPLPPAPSLPLMATVPQFRYSVPVESTIKATTVIDRVLSEKVFLSVKELLALSLEVRKYFKEATTTKCLLALPTAAGTHTVLTFSVGATHDLLEAAPTLPLRTLDVILNGSTAVIGILDSRCQVVIIRRDVWEKLGAPLKHDQVMFMESANSQANVTMGTLQRICFTVRDINLHCMVQVIQEAPFECLIGWPFTALAQMVSREFQDGTAHLTLTDPNTGASVTVPTQAREPVLRKHHHTCPSKKDFH